VLVHAGAGGVGLAACQIAKSEPQCPLNMLHMRADAARIRYRV
jgi:hypothetical protein